MTRPPAAAALAPGAGGTLADLDLVSAGTGVLGLALLAGFVAAGVAAAYRLSVRERVADGVLVLAGAGAVAVYLNAATALGQVIEGETAVLSARVALFNTAALLAAAAIAPVGGRVGDRLAGAAARVGRGDLDRDIGELVRSVGRTTTVTLPETVEDLEGHDPVASSTRAALAGATLQFPRGLTVEALEERLTRRLAEDYGVGRVDVAVSPDGTVEHLAVGEREAGLGPTLPPGTAAVAVRADPPNAASAGDVVQLWRGGEDRGRLASGELRAAVGDVATVALDAEAAPEVAGSSCRLVTLPGDPGPEREFADRLRAADATMGVVTVESGSPLEGVTVGAVDATVVAVAEAGGGLAPIPPRDRALTAGDRLYVVARPDAIRDLEAAGTGNDNR